MKKYVLTGGPGSGKSSILLRLERLGYKIVRECAEDVIRYNQAKGNKQPWTEIQKFQDEILDLQNAREKELTNEPHFLDRGSLDGLAYYKLSNTEPSEKMKKELEQKRDYDLIFLVKNLGGCETNEVRRENLDESLKIEQELKRIYEERGYRVEEIRGDSVEERVKEILKYI